MTKTGPCGGDGDADEARETGGKMPGSGMKRDETSCKTLGVVCLEENIDIFLGHGRRSGFVVTRLIKILNQSDGVN